MNTLAIMASHRPDKNTRQALDYFLEELACDAPEIIDINQIDVTPCTGCDYCLDHQGECVLSDDMDALYTKIAKADLIVLASPVYFSAFPSKIKAVIDRGQLFYNLKDKHSIVPKQIVLIATGGAPAYNDQFSGLYATLRVYLANVRGRATGSVEIPSTDTIPFAENTSAREALLKLAQETRHRLATMRR